MPVLVVDIDLGHADLTAFDGYEAQMLALLPQFGGKIERRMRSDDASREFHILHFDTDEGFAAFLASPDRAALQTTWPNLQTSAKVYRVSDL